ncbi:MAG: hypothetical protein QXO70_04285 [Candidatus Pacearchaeota archaeon]
MEKNGKGLSETEIKQGSTHEQIKEKFSQLAIAKKGVQFKEKKFKSTFKILKTYRVRADYKSDKITINDVNVFKKAFVYLQTILNDYEEN